MLGRQNHRSPTLHPVWSENWIRSNLRRFFRPTLAIMALKTQSVLDPFRFLLISVAGWMNQQQKSPIDYLREENRILREQLGGKRLRLNDDQRRRLAVQGETGWYIGFWRRLPRS